MGVILSFLLKCSWSSITEFLFDFVCLSLLNLQMFFSVIPQHGVASTTTTTTTTTQAPTTASCTDVGWHSGYSFWSCQRLSDYFMAQYSYPPTYWCRDPNWKGRCCAFCAGIQTNSFFKQNKILIQHLYVVL